MRVWTLIGIAVFLMPNLAAARAVGIEFSIGLGPSTTVIPEHTDIVTTEFFTTITEPEYSPRKNYSVLALDMSLGLKFNRDWALAFRNHLPDIEHLVLSDQKNMLYSALFLNRDFRLSDSDRWSCEFGVGAAYWRVNPAYLEDLLVTSRVTELEKSGIDPIAHIGVAFTTHLSEEKDRETKLALQYYRGKFEPYKFEAVMLEYIFATW